MTRRGDDVKHVPEKRQSIRPPSGIWPLLLMVAGVLAFMIVFIGLAVVT